MTERVRWHTARGALIIFLSIVVAAIAISTCVSYWWSVEFRLSGMNGRDLDSIAIGVREGRLSFKVTGIEHAHKRAEFSFLSFEYKVISAMLGAPYQIGKAWVRHRLLRFPAWIAILLSATYPIIAFIRGPLRRRRRRKRGQCLSCGYNLTGNTSGVCPECATMVEG